MSDQRFKERSFSKRQSVKNFVASSQNWTCKTCNILLPARFELDHIVPCSLQGKDILENLQVLCPLCHSKKTFFDMQNYYDQQVEFKTGTSKYFNQNCFSFIAHSHSPTAKATNKKQKQI